DLNRERFNESLSCGKSIELIFTIWAHDGNECGSRELDVICPTTPNLASAHYLLLYHTALTWRVLEV
ncbi:hypothetical protein NPIL_440731, partial [Nephila pilipes]